MGYAVHITRQKDWSLNEPADQISMEEWKAYIESDPEMRLDNFAEAITNQGETIRIEKEGLSVWTAYSSDGMDGNHAWMDYNKGSITVKNPDDEIIQKMIRIAGLLKADVQGDDGDYYLQRIKSESQIPAKSPLPRPENSRPTGTKPWWKLWS